MTRYQLYVLHGVMVSRERAASAWEEADRIEARTLHAGVVDALREIGWVVDVDDSEEDYGHTRWLLWLKDVNDFTEIVAGTPLGHLGLLKAKSLDLEDAPSTLEWLERVRDERGSDPEPPAAGNVFEQLLETVPLRDVGKMGTVPSGLEDTLGLLGSSSSGFGAAEKILVAWAMYCRNDRAIKKGQGGAIVELRDNLRKALLKVV